MRKINFLALMLIVLVFQSCGQNTEMRFEGYSQLEIDTEKCLDNMFEKSGANLNALKEIFENYFSSGKISNLNDPVEKQYEDILTYWEHPSKRFPIFKDKKKVVAIKEKLGLTEKEIFSKSQLDCFTNKYIENKVDIDTTSSFYVFGSALETARKLPDISPGLIAGAIKLSMNKEELKKKLYQKTIVLLFCFDMTLYLTDEKE